MLEVRVGVRAGVPAGCLKACRVAGRGGGWHQGGEDLTVQTSLL